MKDHDLIQEYQQLLRDDFGAFCVRAFAELYPGQELELSEYIEVMASRVVDVHEGRTRRLIINVPPRHLKSLIGSIAFPAWSFGLNPSAQIMCVSYGADLALKLARDTRTIMTSDWYQQLFPDTRLISQKPALEELITTAGGYRLANSVGGSVTGRGADIIIIDDPLKPDEAMSDSQREAVNDWFDGTLMTRLNDQRLGAIVMIMQRLHEDDLVGHALGQEAWEHLCFPAIAEEDEVHSYMTPWGPKTFCRRKGEALHPERLPLDVLEKLKRAMGATFSLRSISRTRRLWPV